MKPYLIIFRVTNYKIYFVLSCFVRLFVAFLLTIKRILVEVTMW